MKRIRTIRGKPVLTRFWFRFGWHEGSSVLTGAPWGVGVTAFDREDALRLVSDIVFADQDVPPVTGVVENIDVQSLDAGHVIPNMGAPSERGVWFPNFGLMPYRP